MTDRLIDYHMTDFTQSNTRWFYSSKEDPLGLKGWILILMADFIYTVKVKVNFILAGWSNQRLAGIKRGPA